MITRLEMELREARELCEELVEMLLRSGFVKFFAAGQREIYLDELDELLIIIDEMENLVVSAKSLIRESRAIRSMLLNNGIRSCGPKLVQLISNESAIAEELLLIQEMKDEKVNRIGKLLRRFNRSVRQLLAMRIAGSGRTRMSLAGLPEADDFPRPISLHLLDEFYEESYQTIRRIPSPVRARGFLPGQNGKS